MSNVKVGSITLEFPDNVVVNLSVDDARDLHRQLGSLFNNYRYPSFWYGNYPTVFGSLCSSEKTTADDNPYATIKCGGSYAKD